MGSLYENSFFMALCSVFTTFFKLFIRGNISMKSVGICRVDKMGRFVIPKRLRREMDLNTGTGLEISVNGNSVILEKVENRCVFCRQKENLKIAFDKYYVCDKCRYILRCILE